MENFLEEQEPQALTDTEIFTKIWFQPRIVFRYINYNNYDKFVPYLIILIGVSNGIERALEKNMGDDFSLESILMLNIFFGGLLTWIFYYIYSALISFTGEWLGGKSKTSTIFNMLSYGLIPTIIILFISILQIILYDVEIFKSDFDLMSGNLFDNILGVIFKSVNFFINLYIIILCVIGLSEIQNFSIWKAILNFLLPILLIFVPIFLLTFIFGDVTTLDFY